MPTNIGNPNEFTILELAKVVIDVLGLKSEIVYEPLPVDDPMQRTARHHKSPRAAGLGASDPTTRRRAAHR